MTAVRLPFWTMDSILPLRRKAVQQRLRTAPDGASGRALPPAPLHHRAAEAMCRLGLPVLDLDADLRAVGADLGDVHRVAEDGEGVELAGDFGAELIADLPDALGELVDEARDLPVPE